MKMENRIGRLAVGLVAFIVGAVAAIGVARAIGSLSRAVDLGGSAAVVVSWEILRLAVPLAGGGVAAWIASRHVERIRPSTPKPLRRRLLTIAVPILVVAYLLTWAFGVPAAVTELTSEDLRDYKLALQRSGITLADPYPYTSTFVGVPVVPGVVLVYHEKQVAGRWGWGGWVWCVWYPGQIQIVRKDMRWIS